MRIYAIRHWIEQSYKQVKDELGWADFQVRSGTAIRRHQTLVNCTFSFCWDTWFAHPAPPAAAPPAPRPGGKREAPVTPPPAPSWPRALGSVRAWLPLDRAATLLADMVGQAPTATVTNPDELGRDRLRPAPLPAVSNKLPLNYFDLKNPPGGAWSLVAGGWPRPLVLEGIEATMFRTISDGPSGWESLLPPEVMRLRQELARVDALLDDPVFFAPFAPQFDPVIGRPSTPVECCLRLMFWKFRCRLGFESLCAEVSDSVSWRRFCRIRLDGRVPHPATLMKLTTRCGEDVVAGLNEALWAKAAGAKLLRTARVRAGTTVIPANVACPAGTGLLAKAAGKLVVTARRVQAAGGATGTTVTGRRRAAARRMRQIASTLRTRGKLSWEESTRVIRRVTGELADLARAAAAEAAAVVRNGRRAVRKALTGRVHGKLVRALDELAVTIERTATIVTRARTRLAGQAPDGAARLVSPHGPDARPVRKGRIGRPAGFGSKAQVTGNDDGIIPGLRRRIRRRPRRAATGTRGGTGHPPRRADARRRHRRPRLWPVRRRA